MVKRILIYHLGSLGDTLVALPAFNAIRTSYPSAHIVLLTDIQKGKNTVQCEELLAGSGLVDEYIYYEYDSSFLGKISRLLRLAHLFLKVRWMRFDALVYLVRTEERNDRVNRDRLFFQNAGIKRIIGMTDFAMKDLEYGRVPLPTVPHITDQLLARLAGSGIAVQSTQKTGQCLKLSQRERQNVRKTLTGTVDDAGCKWIAVGPGSKMPAKVWPQERFLDLVKLLIDRYQVWPIVFGSEADVNLGNELVSAWGRGHVAAGVLNVRESMAAMERCVLYIGNDTGTLHMAAAMGLKCVGLYSARDYPGLWFPYGEGHAVLRHALACEGCMLEVCSKNGMACMLAIQVEDAYHAVKKTGVLE